MRDLIASTSGSKGKWFAAAKSLGLYDLAIELVAYTPTDPRTLIRAARDFSEKQPKFALGTGMAALHWISQGHGYEISTLDVISAHSEILQAASNAGVSEESINERIKVICARPGGEFLRTCLERRLVKRSIAR